jgi:hypothetical protein
MKVCVNTSEKMNIPFSVHVMNFCYNKNMPSHMSLSQNIFSTITSNCILVARPEGRRPLERPRCRWEDNIKMDLRELWFGDVDWIHWAQDRDRWRALVNMVMNIRVP